MSKTMQAVVTELLAEGADAADELTELVYAIREMRACTTALARDAELLAAELESYASLLNSRGATLAHSRRVSGTAAQLAAASVELEKGTDGWGLR